MSTIDGALRLVVHAIVLWNTLYRVPDSNGTILVANESCDQLRIRAVMSPSGRRGFVEVGAAKVWRTNEEKG